MAWACMNSWPWVHNACAKHVHIICTSFLTFEATGQTSKHAGLKPSRLLATMAQWWLLLFSPHKVQEHVFRNPDFFLIDINFKLFVFFENLNGLSVWKRYINDTYDQSVIFRTEPVSRQNVDFKKNYKYRTIGTRQLKKVLNTRQRLQWTYSRANNFPDYKAPVWSVMHTKT